MQWALTQNDTWKDVDFGQVAVEILKLQWLDLVIKYKPMGKATKNVSHPHANNRPEKIFHNSLFQDKIYSVMFSA